MWVLIVLSMVGQGEIKFTEYQRFDDQIECVITQLDLEETFIQNEKAICVRDIHPFWFGKANT